MLCELTKVHIIALGLLRFHMIMVRKSVVLTMVTRWLVSQTASTYNQI